MTDQSKVEDDPDPKFQGWTVTFPAQLSRAGHQALDRLLDMHRDLYNAAIQQRRWLYQHHKAHAGGPEHVNINYQSKALTELRAMDPEWEGQDRRLAVNTLRRLDRAYARFYNNVKAGIPAHQAGRPRYRPRRRFRSISLYAGVNRYLRCDRPGRYRLNVKGCPAVRFRTNRAIPENQPKEIRIVRKPRRVEVQLVYMVALPPVLAPSTEPNTEQGQENKGIGITFGVRQRATTSKGRYEEQRIIDRRRLARLSRRMASLREKALASSRSVWQPVGESGRVRLQWIGGESRRYRQVRESFAKEWQYITEQDNQACHRLTTDVINGLPPGSVVAVTNLNIQNMLKTHALARVISEQAWGRVINQLEYKAARAGLQFEKVSAVGNDAVCGSCGSPLEKSMTSRRVLYPCSSCGVMINRYENNAINVLRRAVYGAEAAPGAG